MIFARQCVAVTLSNVCDTVALMALRADELFHVCARLVLGSARGAGFGDRLRFHSGVTENIHRRFEFIAYLCYVIIREPRRDTTCYFELT